MSEAVSDARPSPTRLAGSAVLIAQHFVPLNVVASQRALRMARTLLDRFERLYVMCGDTSAADPALLDRDYGRDLLEDSRLVRVAIRPSLTGYGYGRPTSRLQRLVGGVATRALCGPGVDWIRPLRDALAHVPASEQVRVVLATGPPFMTFGSAEQFAARRRAAAILDYRDLWTSNPHAPYPGVARALVNRWIERPVNRQATLITTVSEGCRASLLVNGLDVPVRVLYNSPDHLYLDHFRQVVADWQRRRVHPADRARQRFRIVFTGQVYRNCTFAPLLKAIAAMPPAGADRFELHYYGDSSLVARTECQQFGLSRLLMDHGKVAKDESLRAMLDADLLLSLIHTDRVSSDPAVTGHMSTKIYDYFLAGVPILNIGPINGEINQLAGAIGHRGFENVPADDTAAIVRTLEQSVAGGRVRHEPLSVSLPLFDVTLSRILDEAVDRLGAH
jgi:hypothetical protein